MNSVIPIRLKQMVMYVGLIFALLIGFPFMVNLLCIVPLALLNSTRDEAVQFGVFSILLACLTFGAGLSAYWHADRSIKNKSSAALRLPSPLLLAGIFIPLVLFGIILKESGAVVFLPPVVLLAAVLPPLWSLAWMLPLQKTNEDLADTGQERPSPAPLTWRRGLLSFTGGATLSVVLAMLVELVLPLVVVALVDNLAGSLSGVIRSLLRALSSTDVAQALTSPGFIFLFLQLTVIAPLAEEFAKPLVVIPLLKNLDRQQAFWLGALAGAGFAAVENSIYAAFGISMWAGILAVRALGGALHPFGSGLVAMGWREVVNQQPNAQTHWWRQFGIAVAMHAAWNGGSLLVITLTSAGFFGQLPRELDVLGVSAAGLTLAFLLILGIAALWMGRALGHDRPLLSARPAHEEFSLSDQTVALWALVCLAAIVPMGIAGLKLWLR